MLTFVGLGLQKNGLTLQGLKEARDANKVFIELYTSLVPDLALNELEEKISNRIIVLNREVVEEHPNKILTAAKDGKAVFLVPGDPMVATTHIDLRLRAEKIGIGTKIIHGPSIESAAPGLSGLQSYKFGRSATIPFTEKPSETPYIVVKQNKKLGLHTLLLLDIETSKKRYLAADEAIKIMLKLEEKLGADAFTPESLVVVVARAGTSDAKVKGGKAIDLSKLNFGPAPHVLIVPSKLHFLEAEALKILGDTPAEVVERYVER